jgi:hypothetical protein
MTCVSPVPGSPTPEPHAADATRGRRLAGHHSLAAIAGWAADAPQAVLASLGVRRNPFTGVYQPPREATVRRS